MSHWYALFSRLFTDICGYLLADDSTDADCIAKVVHFTLASGYIRKEGIRELKFGYLPILTRV